MRSDAGSTGFDATAPAPAAPGNDYRMALAARHESEDDLGDHPEGGHAFADSPERPEDRGGSPSGEGPEAAPERVGATEDLGAVRHDLKNLLTTLWHGCALASAKLAEGEYQEAQAFLDEMRSCVDKGRALVERLR